MEYFSSHEIREKGSYERFWRHFYISFNQGNNDPIKLNAWFMYPCVYSRLDRHCMVNCWKIQSLYEKLFGKEAQSKSYFPKPKDNCKIL